MTTDLLGFAMVIAVASVSPGPNIVLIVEYAAWLGWGHADLPDDFRQFFDEGTDFRNYTYVRYGRVILDQPDQFAWQIFDQKVIHLLCDEYRIKHVTKVTANTLEELAIKMEDVDPKGLVKEIQQYNAAV